MRLVTPLTVALTLAFAGTATAQPTLTPYKLSVTKSGSGTGQVTSAAGGINCGSTCTSTYSPGVPVILQATGGTGVFMGWSGACSGMATTCSFIMKQNVSVTARFELPKISVSKSGAARAIQVVSTPAGLDCGPTCGANFNRGTLVRLNTAGIPADLFMRFNDGRTVSYDQYAVQTDAEFYDVRVVPESTVVVTAGGGNAGSIVVREINATCSWGAGQTAICRWPLRKGGSYTLASDVPRTFYFVGASPSCTNSTECRFAVPTNKPLLITVR